MNQADAALEAMDAGETPGTRASVDRCEVMASMDSELTRAPAFLTVGAKCYLR